ncbi:MAG TPA: hypothetical protein PLK80_02455, partial [bacterium]|nr:hypothetical protein [bacterium]
MLNFVHCKTGSCLFAKTHIGGNKTFFDNQSTSVKDLGKGFGGQPFSKGFPQPPQAAASFLILLLVKNANRVHFISERKKRSRESMAGAAATAI